MSNPGRLFPITVQFPLTPLVDVDAISLICLHRVGAMSSARVSLNMRTADLDPYIAAGSPLIIKWRGNGTDNDEFIGYVHSYRPSSEGYQHTVTVIAVGASYPMFNESARVFHNVGIHNVARTIGDDHRFQVETEPHPVVFDQILQQDESDWGLLNRLGDDWGYVVQSYGVRLVFRPLESILKERYRNAVREYTAHTVGTGSTLTEFVPSYSAVGQTPVTKTIGHGVDPTTGTTTDWSTREQAPTGIFKEVVTRLPVASELEAEMSAVAQAARARFPFTARATLLYPAGKQPYDVYQISHEGSTLTWVIQAIKHVINASTYVGEVSFGSDGKDHVGSLPVGQKDIAAALSQKHDTTSSKVVPTITDSQPVFVGTGANAVVAAQRWKARVMQTQEG